MNSQEKYALYKQAKTTGGPCEICGWKDGDGVRTCFYSEELGVVTHQNSEKGVMATMTEAQRNLYQLRQKLVYINAELREKEIQRVAREHHEYVQRMLTQNPDRYPTQDEHGNPISEEAWTARYRAEREKEALATDPEYAGWEQSYWWKPVKEDVPQELRGLEKSEPLPFSGEIMHYTAYMTHVYEVHSCGKGHQYGIEPYHLGCTGCDTEIKLWEHGVDYDMG